MKLSYRLSCLLFLISIFCFAQNLDISKIYQTEETTNSRIENPFGLSLNLGGPTYVFSFSADYYVTSTVNIEAGFGLWGFYGGVTYHFNGDHDEKKWTPYTGGLLFFIPEFLGDDPYLGLYVPLGMQYLNDGGFTFSAEVAGRFSEQTNNLTSWAALKVGYHF